MQPFLGENNLLNFMRGTHMNIFNDFKEIMEYAHFWNWRTDWKVAEEVYQKVPTAFSLLTPFAYSYLEELIRSTTSEYGREIFDDRGNSKKHKVGKDLIKLAQSENRENVEYVALLKKTEAYFRNSESIDGGDNRNSVVHGYMHPRFWNQESFEQLLHDIALLSKYANF